MPALRELQKEFAAALLWGRDPGRAQVYRNNVFLGLASALADVYPVTRRLVGEAFFAQAARRFIRIHPSRSPNLHDFGRELPIYLACLPETSGLAYLSDVAALEWAFHEVFHEADAAPFDFTELQEAENAVLSLQPALRLVASRFPVLAIWEANQIEDVRTVDIDAGASWLAVQRRGLSRVIERLSAGEFALLRSIQERSTLAEACDAAVAAESALDLSAAMGRLVHMQVFAKGASS